MAIRLLWDEQEALLLFDTYEKIEKNPNQRGALVSALSINLRRRASDNGAVIDSTFRNTNGISMRISEIDKILHPESIGLTKTSELFRTTANLYSSHRRAFLKRLQEVEEYRVKLLPDMVGFDFLESAVLLDALLYIEKSGVSKAYTSRLVSAKLRTLAINRGCIIGESYRSDSGIMGRLRKMDEALRSNNSDAPQVFVDVISLYRSDNKKYNTVLKKANSLIGRVVLPEDIEKKAKERQLAKDAAPVQKTQYVKTKKDRKLKETYPKEFMAVYRSLESRFHTDPEGVTATTIFTDLKKKYPRKVIIEILEGASWAKEIRAGRYAHVLGASFMATQESNEKKFFSWLKKKIPLSQYTVMEKNKTSITLLLVQKKAFKTPIFLIEDPEEISKAVNKVPPCFANVKLKSAAIQLVTMYATYLEEKQNAVECADDETVESSPAVNIDDVLSDSLFNLLRDELKRHNISSTDELQKIDLWAFMNRYNLYSIGTRQTVLEKVQKVIERTDTPVDRNDYILHIDSETHLGSTPAEAFLHFCESISIAYPLTFRSLIGIHVPGYKESALYRNGDVKAYLKMKNINSFVRPDLTEPVVCDFTRWICVKCGKKAGSIHLEEPSVARPLSEPPKQHIEEATTPAATEAEQITSVSSVSSTRDYRDSFMSWLSSRVFPQFLEILPPIYTEIEAYAIDHKLLTQPLFLEADASCIKRIRRAISDDKEFRKKHSGHMSKYTAAIAHYAAYLTETSKIDISHRKAPKVNPISAPNSKPTSFEEVMNIGTSLLSAMELEKVQPVQDEQSAYAPNSVDRESTPEDRVKKIFIKECSNNSHGTTLTYLRAYLPGLDAGTIESILDAAPWAKRKYGNRWVYCSDQPAQKAAVAQNYDPVKVVSETAPTDDRTAQPTPTASPAQPSSVVTAYQKEAPVQEAKVNPLVPKLEKIVLDADIDGISYEGARDELGIPLYRVKPLAAESGLIVDVNGKLIHEEAFIDWEDGADALETILEKLMHKNNGYATIGQLFEYARIEMNMFLNDNDLSDERSVYDIARHLFEKNHYHDKQYSFVGNMHISRSAEKITSNMDIYKKYAADQGGVFRFSKLIEYLESISVSTANLRVQMRMHNDTVFFMYDEDEMITSESMNMDDAWEKTVAEALKALFTDVGDHIILRQIPAFWFDRLPALPGGRPWTPLLLQSVLRFYSKEFNCHTIRAMEGQSMETLHTMLVENDGSIQNFGDVVIAYLMENEIEKRQFKAEDLRWMLVKAGILHGNELIWNMPKALKSDSRFAWDVKGENVTVII